MFWLPEELLERRVREDRIPYDLWKEQGYLRTCEGNKVRQKDVTEWFLEVQNELDCYIYCGGYDAWSASYWVDEMQDTFGKLNPICCKSLPSTHANCGTVGSAHSGTSCIWKVQICNTPA